MDKAQARILTLVLIAVLFIGQALYDFIKKNRSRSVNRPRQTINKPGNRIQASNRQSYQKNVQKTVRPKMNASSDRSKLEAELYPSVKSEPVKAAVDETIEPINEKTPHQSQLTPAGDDLRRAVIWSEILKRKF